MTDSYEEFMKVANEYYEKYVPEVPKEFRFKDFPWFETRSSKEDLIYTRVGFYGFVQCFMSGYHSEVDVCFQELADKVRGYMEGSMTEPAKTSMNKEYRAYAHNMRLRMSNHDWFEPCPFCESFELEEKDSEISCCGCGLRVGLPIGEEKDHRCLKI